MDEVGGDKFDWQKLKLEIKSELMEELTAEDLLEPKCGCEWGVPEVDVPGGDVDLPPRAFDYVIDGQGIEISNLFYVSGLRQFKQAGTLSGTLPDAATAYIGYELVFATGVIALVAGASLIDVSEMSQPVSTATGCKRALYYFSSKKVDGKRVWKLECDMRDQPVNVIRM